MFTTAFIGIFLFIQNRHSDYVETTGIVINQEYTGDNTYRAIAQYAVDGVIYTVRESGSSSFPPDIGSEVTVLYNPQDAYIKTGKTLMLLIYGLFAIFYAAGIFVLIKGLRMPKDNESI